MANELSTISAPTILHESLPSSSGEGVCRNCAAELRGRYCHQCGQPNRPLDPTFHDLWRESVHEFLHVDGKIWRSLKLLLLKPGALTEDFLKGRRVRHIGPFRLYLTISLVFFFLFMHLPQEKHGKTRVETVTVTPNPTTPTPSKTATSETAGKPQNVSDKIDINTGNQHLDQALTATMIQAQIANRNHDEYNNKLKEKFSHAMFFLLPIFALLVRALYRRTGLHYPACLYFSIHFHSFFFLLFSLSYLLAICSLGHVEIPGWLLSGVGLAYLFLALKRVFGGDNRRTVWNIAKLLVAYLPMLLLTLTGTAVWTLFAK